MTLYKRINEISETIDKSLQLKEFFQEVPKATDEELKERELRAINRLLEVIKPNLIEVCDVLKVGKEYIDSFDLSELPPSITETEMRGIPLLSLIHKNEEDSFIIALMSNSKFYKSTFTFSKKLKVFEKFKFEELELDDVLKMIPCELLFTSIEKDIKAYEKRVKDSKPSHIQRQEFLLKIGG